MHACGHDAHTAVLLGVAGAMVARAADLPGRYLFVFQPGEEQFKGARAMLDAGLLDALPVDAMVGWHVWAPLPSGVVKIRPGVAASDAQVMRITFTGAGGHAALGGPSVLSCVARLLGSLSSAVSGLEHEGSSCTCTAGVVRASSAFNVVPTEATIEGSLRTFTPAQAPQALARLRHLVAEAAGEGDAAARVEITAHAPAVRDDPAVTEVVTDTARALLGAQRMVTGAPLTPSDDVSELLNRVPGCYFQIGGARPDGRSGAHHSPRFDFDEEAMKTAALVMGESARRLAQQPVRSDYQ